MTVDPRWQSPCYHSCNILCNAAWPGWEIPAEQRLNLTRCSCLQNKRVWHGRIFTSREILLRLSSFHGFTFCTRPYRTWGPPRPLDIGYRSLFLLWSGRGVALTTNNPSSPSSAEVKERVERCVYSPSGLLWFVIGWALPLSFIIDSWLAVNWK
jgi:hypothetical protein